MPFVCKFSSSLSIKNTTDSGVTHPESRPMSPEQQMDVMLQQEMEIESKEQKPSELDLEVLSYCAPLPTWQNVSRHRSDSKEQMRVTWGMFKEYWNPNSTTETA